MPLTKGGHKRNLSNGTPDNSPPRRSKRQRSTVNLKEASSAEESGEEGDLSDNAPESETLAKSTSSKGTRTKKTQVAFSVKQVPVDSKETDSKIETGNKEGRSIEVKAEIKAAPTTQKPKTSKRGKKSKEEKDAEAMPLAPRTQGLRMFVGAHVSAAKGVFNSITNSTHIGGNAFALFLKSQRKWENPPLQDEHRDQFRKMSVEHNYDAAKHVLPHGSYLVNLAQNDKAKAKQAYDAFLDDLRRCEALGIRLYNFHPGSTNQTPLPEALSRLADSLTKAISETSTVIPVLETMCGHGNTIGGSLSEFRDLLALIPKEHHSRIGICIDTCHSFAAGYDLVSPEGFKAFLTEFDELIGLEFLRALHLNDSKAPRGSKRDLHANIGTGFLGLRAFHNVMNEPRFEGLPMVLETPIDRVPGQSGSSAVDNDDDGDSCASESEKKKPKKGSKRPAKASPATVPDHGVWAREIKLLESLIGMDPDGEEFRELEAKLSEEGRAMREKQQEQYERKLEADKKKEAKGNAKAQKSLMDMMKKKKNKD
ncbi:DNA-(apurinic or apyrimidinic site) lyase 1 [Penicillium macrosclerotiorum]|uniref:DNA-(apurinic or apyrimidinic site) lyase 1 n=1 Tax=Penicillium macrosclerotiorum TaxID=303699 RepID=UPI00254794C3|nr:DNA-(apurinic or apyrimidinic site) lyase 1 [Penicillium macrosclerotiorum]KAJ5662698.1 DNA-(apurinic or apyrimidinic site) lyase 1 [Penicillium macrosclerotiorum]